MRVESASPSESACASWVKYVPPVVLAIFHHDARVDSGGGL